MQASHTADTMCTCVRTAQCVCLQPIETWAWLKLCADGRPVVPFHSKHKRPYECAIVGVKRQHSPSEQKQAAKAPPAAKLSAHVSRFVISAPCVSLHSSKPPLEALLCSVSTGAARSGSTTFDPAAAGVEAPADQCQRARERCDAAPSKPFRPKPAAERLTDAARTDSHCGDGAPSPSEPKRRKLFVSTSASPVAIRAQAYGAGLVGLELFARNLRSRWCSFGDQVLMKHSEQLWLEQQVLGASSVASTSLPAE